MIAKPKRRWFQFSLKTLLIAIFLVSVPLAAFVWRRERARQQTEVVEALRKLHVQAGYPRDDSDASKWRWDFGERVLSRDFFENVVAVNASQYRRVGFIRTGAPIPLSDAHRFWESVYRLPALQYLIIFDDQVTPQNLDLLAQNRRLEALHIQTALVNDEHLREIGKLRGLKGLVFGADYLESEEQASISYQGVSYLRALPKLTFLDLSATTLDDRAAESLADLENLESLYLINTAISDDGLRHLARLRKLTVINVSGSRVTSAGSDELQAALPNCKIQNFVPYDPAD